MQHERHSLGRRKGVEDDLHRPGRPVGEECVGLRVDRWGIGRSLAGGLRPGPSLAQVVQTQPRHDGGQPGGQVVDVVGAGEPQPGLLHDVVSIGIRPEYPGGDPGQPGSLGVEFRRVVAGHILLTYAAIGM